MARVAAVVVSRAGRANFVHAVCSVPASGGLIPSPIKLPLQQQRQQTPLSNQFTLAFLRVLLDSGLVVSSSSCSALSWSVAPFCQYRTDPNNSPPNHTHHTHHTQPCLRRRPWKLASRRSLPSEPNLQNSNDNVLSAKRSLHRRVRVEMQQRYVEEGHIKVRPPLTQPAHLPLALAC
jgi:hypothetical protein